MKTCFKCGESKQLSEFYAHPSTADRYLNKCKECTRADVAAGRANKIEEVREYDRRRAKEPRRKARAAEYQKRYRKENRDKQRAQRKVAYYVRAGQLTPMPCEQCGATDHVHAHHDDYTKPLDIIWLCAKHHKQRHKEMEA